MNKEIEKILTLVAERAQLSEGIEGVRSILLTMYRFPSLKNKKVSQKTGIAIPTLTAVRSELVKAGIIEKRNFLGDKGRNWVKRNLNLNFEYDPLPENFDSILRELPDEFSYLNEIKSYLENRPSPEFALDQSHADFPTVLKKTLYLLKKGDIEGRRLIFLGDDDFISLSVGLTKLANEITVVDIDDRILDFLSNSASKLSLKNFNVLHHDLRESIPKSIVNKYDVAVMDPPYTNEGLRLFLKRAKQVLKSNITINDTNYLLVGKRCVLSFGNKPPNEMQKLQLSILDHGFIITEMIPDFNHYKGASIIGQFSHLYYLQTVAEPESKYKLSFASGPIYTSEIKRGSKPPFLPVGFHFIGELHFSKQKSLLDNELIQKIFINSLQLANLTVLDIYHHNYQPYGYSAIATLQTSHAAIHTWPEHGYISLDIFICDKFSKGIQVIRYLKEKFKPEKAEFFYIERGNESMMTYKAVDLG
ncbi:MAG: adenosylmethionine decarboxylase [Candidatus Lokiarchaeota archaeon]|nr:adenosylmethionine decarboxylase [Candidatus Lokiarchaeota archaeon]